jgi:hypothetical protein
MAKQPMNNEPGPGRFTAETAFGALTRDIAKRNDATHVAARKVRSAREHEQVLARRRRDLL